MSWGTTPMHPDNTSQSSLCRREQAAASVVPLSRDNGTFPSMAKGGRGEASKLGALIKPHFSCLECWATRTMRWWGSWGTFKEHSTHSSRDGVLNAADAGIVLGKVEGNSQMTQQTFRGDHGFILPLLLLIYTDPSSWHILKLDSKGECGNMAWTINSGLMEVFVGVQR